MSVTLRLLHAKETPNVLTMRDLMCVPVVKQDLLEMGKLAMVRNFKGNKTLQKRRLRGINRKKIVKKII